MQSSLSERLHAWSKLFTSRDDLEFRTPLSIGEPKDLPETFPEDIRDLARHAAGLEFSYRGPKVDWDRAVGSFCLALGQKDEAYLELDGQPVPEEDISNFDADIEGTGEAAFVILRAEGGARVVWSVESTIVFESATQYLTEGARRGFEQGWPASWRDEDPYSALAKVSLSKETPLPEILSALVARGATPAMAADLVEWLGQDVCLLLPPKT